MTPTQAIETLDSQLIGVLERMVTGLRTDAAAIKQQWTQLGNMHAQRDDHAADMLHGLSDRLGQIQTYADICKKQIEAMRADPFGRERRS